MATRYCCALGLSLLVLSCFVSATAVAELRPVKAWHCTIAAPDAQTKAESPRDRKITLYEFRSPDNCLDDALPPVGMLVCRADYTKDGGTETVWRARNNRDYCRPRAEALVQDLDKAGFYCTTLDIEGCEKRADLPGDAAPVRAVPPLPDTEALGDVEPVRAVPPLPDTEALGDVEPVRDVPPSPDTGAVSDAEPVHEAVSVPAAEPAERTSKIKTPTASAVRKAAPIDKTASREKQLLAFFNGLFDASLAKAMTKAAIPDDFDVLDGSTLSTASGETLRFTKGTHAWETRRDEGVLVINADFQHGSSFNDVFFGFTFDRSNSKNESDRHQIHYLGVVSPETSSEVIYAGKDKIIISSKWYAKSKDCYSSHTTDEYKWSDSIYGTLQMRTISADNNPDCPDR